MSTVKAGDVVRFIDEKGGGRVIRILSDELAEVETPDGWILPAYISTLVVIPDSRVQPEKPAAVNKPADRKAGLTEKDKGIDPAGKAPQKKPSPSSIPARQIDLHINKLIDRVVGLTNTEILNLQLDTFRKELRQAIRGNEREIIFIHGIGNGTLKNELRRIAGLEFKWCQQEDASFREYGFGATRIRIPQNKPF